MIKSEKLIILGILIVLTLGVGIAYSIFLTTGDFSTTDQGIAKFIFNADEVDAISVPLYNLIPGDTKNYLFSISNSNDSFISEVTVEYQIIVKTYHFIPLNINLYEVGEVSDTLIMECDESYTRSTTNILICNAPLGQMSHDDEYTNEYRLEIVFPNQYNDYSYSGLIDFIDLEIKSWQKV